MTRTYHCVNDGCGGHRDPAEAIIHGQHRMAAELRTIRLRLAGIDHTLSKEGTVMAELDDRLAALTTSLSDLADDLTRELTDLTNALSGALTPDQQTALQNVQDKVAGLRTAIDTADPGQPTT